MSIHLNDSAIDFAIGREFTSELYPVDSDAAAAYSESIDRPARARPRVNIHNDDAAAKKAGYRAPIAAGEQTYAVMANYLFELLGESYLRGGRLEASLIKPVFYGDVLTMHARVIERTDSAIEFEVWTDNDRGERVLAGAARIAANGARSR
jgi:acyl dehydratase